jgi:hypothetical protein
MVRLAFALALLFFRCLCKSYSESHLLLFSINKHVVLSGSLVTTAWRVLGMRLQMWSVAANTLNKQSRTADKGWFSSLEVGRGADNSSP